MKNLLLFFVLMWGIHCYAQKDVHWTYPVLPGTDVWANLTNYQEKVNVCQIPEDLLRTINTPCLIQLCLNYPLLLDIYSFNQMSQGFEAFYSNFNGIRELVSRDDAVDELIAFYKREQEQQISILNNSVVPLEKKGNYIFQISAIEMFLGCPQLQANQSAPKQKEVMKILLDGYEKKYDSLSEFKGLGFYANVFSRANLINKINPNLLKEKNKNVYKLINGVVRDIEAVEELNQMSYQLIRK
ncbi:hypothetical protein [Parabacteroides sp.]|uniref:hypothetical protein n=1 Tax=Parabacteroides sp. TaxID=1869337 RepID=UPI0026E024FE|nr:hypothetical protein [Parabacteroides sp.]MDO5430208.1 hypothetical protein [Parabacteroides sp.]